MRNSHTKMPSKESSAVLWAAKAFGDWNYIIFITTTRMEEVHNFILAMKSEFLDMLRKYETLYAYKEHKYSYYAKTIRREFLSSKKYCHGISKVQQNV
ncbi:MAG: hypothetical protein WC916_01400 [Candidatus Woesearchaeota archaeon]